MGGNTPLSSGAETSDDPGGVVGIICEADHDVFAAVADILRARSLEVRFFEPGRRLAPAEIDALDLLANKKVAPASIAAIRYAERHGVPTWNGYSTVLLGIRLVGLRALEAVGFDVPPVATEKPAEGDYVAKSYCDWYFEPDPERNGEGDLYQRLVPADPVDHKYYGVGDGEETRVVVLRTTSKLHGEKEYLGTVDPDPVLAARVRRLMGLADAQAIGVDVVWSEGVPYAVDVNPAMSFRYAGMEDVLADSMVAAMRRPERRASVEAGD
ncbi:MAG: hypothetical protein ABEJ22_04530 [Haloferacaceae archaeon]